MDLTVLRQNIEHQAHDLGFELVGVTKPDPPPHMQVYERWLAQGRHAEMSYLATDRARVRRAEPARLLDDCRSILMLGFPYSPAPILELDQPTDRLYGKVASYAWGDDYHDVLAERMRAIAVYIEAQMGKQVSHRWYTDTGPILERDLAQRAGLGWIGKNTCLIHPRRGSYFFLAEIFLDLDLEPDPAFQFDRCGSCTRCLEACPTRCILPDRTIDSRRCISYLTIELKGGIPLPLRAQIGDWVFGCDICQQVCPWNQRFSANQGAASFGARHGVPRPDLLEHLQLNSEAFNRTFKSSPMKRTKRRGYLRNVVVALGNHRDPAAIPKLEQTLMNEPESVVRGHAAWALGSIGGEQARQALVVALRQEIDSSVRVEIQNALTEA